MTDGTSRGGVGETDFDLVRSLGRTASVGVSSSGLVDPEMSGWTTVARADENITAGNFENAVRWLFVESRCDEVTLQFFVARRRSMHETWLHFVRQPLASRTAHIAIARRRA